MTNQLRFAIATASLLLLGGCTIVPGLHLHAPERYGDAGATVERVSQNEQLLKLNQPDGVISAIRVFELNNQTLRLINSTAREISGEPLPEINPAEYTLGAGDVINVIVWDHPELTSPSGGAANGNDVNAGRVIDSKGRMYYPYAGTLIAAGLTIPELRDLLVSRLSRFIKDPMIDVKVTSYRSRRVQVSGQVKNPGLVLLDDTEKGVLEAINERGGLADAGSPHRVELTREGKTYSLNTQHVISNRGDSVNPLLRHGDVVFVPDRNDDQIFLLGSVKKEGPVLLGTSRTTLVQALASAEGLDRLSGDDSGILVFRKPVNAGEVATVIKLDLGSPIGMLLASEFNLQSRDVVYVAATDFSKYNSVVNQLLPTISAIFQTDALVRRIGGN